MTEGITTRTKVDFSRAGRGRIKLAPETPPKPELPPAIPRVSRLMALAIRCENLIRAGEVADFAELARLGMVSRARMTQIMSLLHLAPDIQEQVLFLQGTSRGQDAVTERHMRPITMELDWEVQRVRWGEIVWGAL